VFVKNLENVQGDERDIIIFSVAFGPDAAGRVSSQISSLNKKGGHRRLNVAITRARSELLVFATLRPEQIDLAKSNSQGIVDFKHFLKFTHRSESLDFESISVLCILIFPVAIWQALSATAQPIIVMPRRGTVTDCERSY
jgi:superfamily I DNA and/or RNA helicase